MLRSFALLSILLCCASLAIKAARPEPVHLILDTDMGNDIDDALALAMIHALQTRGEVQLLAVTTTKDNRFAGPFVDLVNTFYGRAGIPIGVVRHGKAPEDAPMLRVPAEKRDAQGGYLYPHRLLEGNQAAEAVQLLYRILKEQPDQSVTIAQIGFSTNLARLIQSEDGKELVKRKVKSLCVMAGNFEKPQPEYNVITDAEAAQRLFADWPTPIIFSGFEVGLLVTYPYESIEKDFSYTANHPVVDAYKLYVGKPEDHPNWDSTAVLYAVRSDRDYFDLSAPGRVALNAKNATVFTPDPAGQLSLFDSKTPIFRPSSRSDFRTRQPAASAFIGHRRHTKNGVLKFSSNCRPARLDKIEECLQQPCPQPRLILCVLPFLSY